MHKPHPPWKHCGSVAYVSTVSHMQTNGGTCVILPRWLQLSGMSSNQPSLRDSFDLLSFNDNQRNAATTPHENGHLASPRSIHLFFFSNARNDQDAAVGLVRGSKLSPPNSSQLFTAAST
jgi:hypothetical protein